MKKATLDKLTSVLGPKKYSTQPEDLAIYSCDPHTTENLPEMVIFPESTADVIQVMKIAHENGIPVTPRGSGTNLAGQTIPLKGGIVLATSKMNKIKKIDQQNRLALVEPGVINYDLQREVGKFGLMYPPDPASWKIATMGGNVATNAGGPKTIKYGVTRDYLLGLTAVLADGRVLKTGGQTIKNVTGFDLTRLLCGSEGTLAVITEITVKLVPKPEARRTVLGFFSDLEDTANAVKDIVNDGILASSLELMDRVILDALAKDGKVDLNFQNIEGLLLIEVDGHPAGLEDQVSRIEKILLKNHSLETKTAKSDEEAEMLWTARRSSYSTMARLKRNVFIEDATVPISNITKMIAEVKRISKKYDLLIGVLAHAGDGNLHPNILFNSLDKDEFERVDKAAGEIFEKALELGGTLSGEHGIGMAKAKFLPLELDDTALEVTKKIKQVLDPKGILNPGKFV